MDELTAARMQRENWPAVRAHVRCACTSPDPIECTGSPEASGTPQCGPAPTHRQCSCHHIRTENEHADIRQAAEARNQFDPVRVLRDFSDAASKSPHPDAAVWAEALKWAASRIRGGHGSIYADKEFGEQFGVHPYRQERADRIGEGL